MLRVVMAVAAVAAVHIVVYCSGKGLMLRITFRICLPLSHLLSDISLYALLDVGVSLVIGPGPVISYVLD